MSEPCGNVGLGRRGGVRRGGKGVVRICIMMYGGMIGYIRVT